MFPIRKNRRGKGMRRAFAAALAGILCCTQAAGAAPVPPEPAPPRDAAALPILMYHEVKYKKLGKDVILPGELEGDLRWLRDNGYHSVFMRDVIACVRGGAPLPEKPVVLSFDDGYLNTYVYAYPLFRKYGMKMVLSVIGKNTDDFTKIPDTNLDYSHVTWEQLGEMLRSGTVEVQNHTYNLHHITRRRFGCQKRPGESAQQYEETLRRDIGDLQTQIRLMTGETPSTFTYPYGRVSEESRGVIKRLGFQASLTCDYGVNVLTRDPECLFGLRRIARPHGVSAAKSLKGAMEALRYRQSHTKRGAQSGKK